MGSFMSLGTRALLDEELLNNIKNDLQSEINPGYIAYNIGCNICY